MPEAAVTFVNSMARASCAFTFEMKIEQMAVNASISARTKLAVIGQRRSLQLSLEGWDMVQLVV
jgi:hypothetical protein